MSKFEKLFQDPNELLLELASLEKIGYRFRGVELQEHLLTPRACRPHEIKINIANYPFPYKSIVKEWFLHEDILQTIQIL
ncbi:MAG: hypothetical protein ACD_46C00178G0002 [uncultured bacterium]|nr:MAG: hypothetical protein ACD_46C00178G0002 [uncultured bacterium]